ncbi:MAG: lipase, partial [Sciscionella sp.]
AADALDDQIAKEAANAGFDFVDVRAAFADHGICSSDWWLNSTTWPITDSYHPNAKGHADGYLPALDAVTS